MFRRYPYRGWLLLSILFWCIAGFRYYEKTQSMSQEEMATTIAEDLQNKQNNCKNLLADEALITRIFSEKLTPDDVNHLTQLPYYVYGYDSVGGLMFWNTNEILVDCNYPRNNTDESLQNIDKGSFVKKCVTINHPRGRKNLTILFPVAILYPFENNYLKSRFVAGLHVPVNTTLTTKYEPGSFPVRNIHKEVLFYVSFPPDSTPIWIPGKVMLTIIVTALLFTIIWLQLITIYLTRKKTVLIGFVITVTVVVGIRWLTYIFGLPFNLNGLPIFSPQLYASSVLLPSLGDLLINALCFLWIVVFMLRHVPHNLFSNINSAKWIKITVGVVIAVILARYYLEFIKVISSIVIDSRISFDVSHFYSITFYTLVGLFTIGIITCVSCLVIYFFNVQLSNLFSNRWLKYFVVGLAGFLIIFSTNQYAGHEVYYMLLGWLILFIFLLDIRSLTFDSDLFAPQMIFWAVFVCIFCTGILQYFNHIKEKETRKRFAEQVIKQRDYVTEYAFKNVSQSIQKDPVIRNFLLDPTPERRRVINERFDALYLGGQLNKFQSNVLLYDSSRRSLYNSDTISYAALENELKATDITMDPTLYYREEALDGHYYIAYIPVQSDSAGNVAGYVFIDFAVKVAVGESVYPELLQPGNVKSMQDESGYAYGIYVKDRLITQVSEYAFPVILNTDTINTPHTFINWENSSELWHKTPDNKTVVVIRYYKLWLESMTLFSYLFGIQMLIVLFIVLYRLTLSYFTKPKLASKLINLTLRKRIHFSMLGVVLISFLVIGLVTIGFFIFQYKQSNKKKILITLQTIERSLTQNLKQEKALANVPAFKAHVNSSKFKYFVSTLANAQKVDINIFDPSGILSVTSQENIYDKFLLARIIKPDAFYVLNNQGSSLVIQDETIGRLSFLSGYVPLRAENGEVLGYINVPFFASEKELNYQISNILVALINLYAFIFLVSSFLTVFITRWLTRTLSIVINRFERLSLTQNELIEWPYEDEIGTLVKEYNKMVKKVEENAILLAQNEREMAWREMARQVAHEIKNPLTPMKLNIQYLQQALKSGYANVEALALKVTESLIEQIDNLSYIASEFSNFAKMPEARPEEIELNELLEKAVELYLNEEGVKVSIAKSKEHLYVYADRSQLLRVFTNLLENAVQAIPDERAGYVAVSIKNEGESAVILFKDNGNGISQEVIEKIFQPYFTTKSSGTGLGLAMTKKIVEFWKGSIYFETEEGKGTTFFITIPLLNKPA